MFSDSGLFSTWLDETFLFVFLEANGGVAPHYPKPLYPTIVEPFCGSAAYSLHYPDYQIQLYDVDPITRCVWHYLIKVSAEEILSLPLCR